MHITLSWPWYLLKGTQGEKQHHYFRCVTLLTTQLTSLATHLLYTSYFFKWIFLQKSTLPFHISFRSLHYRLEQITSRDVSIFVFFALAELGRVTSFVPFFLRQQCPTSIRPYLCCFLPLVMFHHYIHNINVNTHHHHKSSFVASISR